MKNKVMFSEDEKIISLEETQDAVRYLSEGHAREKIVIKI